VTLAWNGCVECSSTISVETWRISRVMLERQYHDIMTTLFLNQMSLLLSLLLSLSLLLERPACHPVTSNTTLVILSGQAFGVDVGHTILLQWFFYSIYHVL
jgi:hypothetical protein